MSSTLKKYLPYMLGVVVLLFGFLVYTGNARSQAASLHEIRNEIAGVESKIKTQKLVIENNQNEITEVVTGSLGERRLRDDKIVEAFFEKVFSWDSFATYNQTREALKTEYKMDPKGAFLQTFFPEVVNETMPRADGTVQEVNRIDLLEMSNQLVSFTSYNTKVDGANYTYFTWVKWSARNNTRTTMGVTETLVSYTINADGEITEVYTYGLPAVKN